MQEVACLTKPLRDDRGRLLPGQTANPRGRNRKIDLRAVAEELAAKEGIDLRVACWQVLKAMIDRGTKGDTNAAKLVFDVLVDKDPQEVVVHDGSQQGVQLPKDPIERREWLTKLSEVARLEADAVGRTN